MTKILTEEHKRKISLAHMGKKKPWGSLRRGIKLSEEHRRKVSLANTGNPKLVAIGRKVGSRPEVIERCRQLGLSSCKRKQTDSEREKRRLSCLRSAPKKENHWNWKGGITPERKILYFSNEYRLWRNAVFERDNYTCVWCGKHGSRLQADHIKPWSVYPELRFSIDNGRTLCKSCHMKTDTWGVRNYKFYVQGDVK
jgi:5-methylcytosine-specific restriction endonuclease McrA